MKDSDIEASISFGRVIVGIHPHQHIGSTFGCHIDTVVLYGYRIVMSGTGSTSPVIIPDQLQILCEECHILIIVDPIIVGPIDPEGVRLP